jgi:hypothetical protein
MQFQLLVARALRKGAWKGVDTAAPIPLDPKHGHRAGPRAPWIQVAKIIHGKTAATFEELCWPRLS